MDVHPPKYSKIGFDTSLYLAPTGFWMKNGHQKNVRLVALESSKGPQVLPERLQGGILQNQQQNPWSG